MEKENGTRKKTGQDSIPIFRNRNGAYSRPGSAPTNRSTTLLINHYEYDDAGRLSATKDPRGLVSKTFYDLPGRTTETVANFVDGVANNADDDQITRVHV